MNAMTPFEEFDPVAAGGTTGKVATIRFLSKGRVHLNAAAARLLDGIEYIDLLFDKENRRLALRAASGESPTSIKLTRAPSQVIFAAALFQQTYQIPLGPRMRLVPEDGLFVADLPAAE